MFRVVFVAASIAMAGGAMAQPWETKLSDGFEGQNFAPEGGLYYRENFEQSAGTVEFQNQVTHTGKGALKLSVVPTCPDSLDGCSERAEIWEKTALRVPYDQGVWYGFAVKFADPIPSEDHRYLIAQWKREIDPGAEGAHLIDLMMKNLRSEKPTKIAMAKVTKIRDLDNDTEYLWNDTKFSSSKTLGLPASNVLQFILEDGTKVSVRPSGTEPKIKFYLSVYEQVADDTSNQQLAVVTERLKGKGKAIIQDFVNHILSHR